jgi:TolB-like protein
LAADVVGYSAVMERAEEATYAEVGRLRHEVIEPRLSRHQGRLIKTTGDGMLAEFASPVSALKCAVEIQDHLASTGGSLQLRIGLNLGDVIVDDQGDVFGEGINIAARLEHMADPGGILISAKVHNEVEGKLDVGFEDRGERQLKNISKPVPVYAVTSDACERKVHSQLRAQRPPSAPRLSIVVLPFANIGGSPEQDYFVDGVTESLTTDLSRIHGAFVIARNTAFSYKRKAIDVKQIGRELNVRYVLEGSVQRGGNRLRVNVQLIDAETGNHLWAERFDKPVADLFDMQDEIVSRLANTLNAQLIAVEARRAERSPHPDATDLCFQGAAWLNRGRAPENMAQARGFYERALALEPENVEALVGTAWVNFAIGTNLLPDDRIERLTAAEAAVTKALSLAPNHPMAHNILGNVQIFTNRAAQGIAECERSLALDRNLARAHANIGIAKLHLGRGGETEAHVEQALRLSPRDTVVYISSLFVGLAKFWQGADAEAMVWLRRSLEANRNYPSAHFYLAAVLAQGGELDEARATAQAGLALNPSFTIRRFRTNAPSNHPVYLAGRERLIEGMRMAGVPEG